MTQDTSRAARRIMTSLGESTRIPILNVEEGDVGVLFGFPIAGLFLASLSGITLLVLPAALVGLTLGVAVVYAAPSQLSAWTWLRHVVRFYAFRPRITHSHAADSGHPSTEGGLVQYTPFTPDERTQDLTNVERAWPGVGAIERTDGTMEAFLEIHPANMDFGMSGDWQAVQEAAQQFANTDLEFPLTVHATTRSFPADQLVDQIEDRLDDPDVQANPAFERLLTEYRETRPAELSETKQLHYYLGVEVNPLDIYNRFDRELTPGEKLAEFPLVGFLFNPFVTRRHDYGTAEQRAKMFETLDDRIRTVRSEFVETVPGWSAARLSTVELFVLAMDFWNGTEHDPDESGHLLRAEPAMDHQPREEEG